MKISEIPKLLKEFHPTKNGDKKPEDFTYGSGIKLWWLCDKGHEFQNSPNQRTSRNNQCPYCSGKRVSKENNLEVLYPEISKEWDYEKNGDLKPNQVTSKTMKKVWWKCKLEHSWYCRVQDRTQKKSQCPKCSNKSSQSEIRIFSEFLHLFPNSIHRHRIGETEYDIYIPSFKIGIEFDGRYFHKKREVTDKKKYKFSKRMGITLIRIREKPLEKISENDILIPHRRTLLKKDVDSILHQIRNLILFETYPPNLISNYLNQKEFQNEEHFEQYSKQLPIPVLEKSFLKTHPQFEKFWDYEKNYPLRPEHFTYGSMRHVWWKCSRGHSYKRPIQSKGLSNNRCPVCYNMSNLTTPRKINDPKQRELQF